MRILLVEDHHEIGSSIQQYLQQNHWHIDWTKSVAGAHQYIHENIYDIVILDRMLPDGTGIELCNYIKTNNADTVVILQTAKSQIEDKLSGFHEGADDYLTKPYDLRELEARIKILIKGKPNIEDTIIDNQLFQCNLTSMQIWKEGVEIHCTHHERILIKLLLEQPGEAISRTIIADYIRGSEGLWQAENNIDVLVSGLRKKLGKNIIQTIKGFGYKIIL